MKINFNILKKAFLVVLIIVAGILYSCEKFSSKSEIISKNENTLENEKNLESTKSSLKDEKTSDTTEKIETINAQSIAQTRQNIYVYVCGAVNSPGVYEMNSEERVNQAIEKAGGFKEDAVKDYINLARKIEDGEKLYIPNQGELEALKESSISFETEINKNINEDKKTDRKININTATKEELMSLKGIGEKRAEDIIDFRKANGKFGTIEDIKKVPGIKENAFEKIKDNITV